MSRTVATDATDATAALVVATVVAVAVDRSAVTLNDKDSEPALPLVRAAPPLHPDLSETHVTRPKHSVGMVIRIDTSRGVVKASGSRCRTHSTVSTDPSFVRFVRRVHWSRDPGPSPTDKHPATFVKVPFVNTIRSTTSTSVREICVGETVTEAQGKNARLWLVVSDVVDVRGRDTKVRVLVNDVRVGVNVARDCECAAVCIADLVIVNDVVPKLDAVRLRCGDCVAVSVVDVVTVNDLLHDLLVMIDQVGV